ncbi:uncharacterized protein LOC133534541 [Cydia pomonella]|uniref:uncharacterized protein LOC133534541 n=1 Tax=Cydia pomonella TaxID=82600 RepID=UPI002ADD4125|nr:uncharacterized protein LOC133534541 [Cydia pomonella]
MLDKTTRILIPIILLPLLITSYAMKCDDILELPVDKKLSLQELQMIPPKDMIQCMAQLGREQMKNEEATYIWTSIINYFGGVADVPDNILMLLHWVTPGIPPEHFSNMTLSSIDVIENFGLNYNLNEAQIAALADRVREDFAGKEPEDYTYYDLTALRQILCGFNRSEIERIHPAAYREAALIISKLERCDPAVLGGFATLAVQEDAFGPPASWSESTWEVVGSVGEYVGAKGPQRSTVVTAAPSGNNTT